MTLTVEQIEPVIERVVTELTQEERSILVVSVLWNAAYKDRKEAKSEDELYYRLKALVESLK